MTLAISVPSLVFLGLSFFDLGQMYVTDRQTSLDTHHRLMRPPYGGGDIIKTATVYYDYYLRVLLNQTISGDHCRSGWSGVSKQDPLAIAGQLEGAMSSNQPCHSSRAIVITEPAAAVLPLPPKKKKSAFENEKLIANFLLDSKLAPMSHSYKPTTSVWQRK